MHPETNQMRARVLVFVSVIVVSVWVLSTRASAPVPVTPPMPAASVSQRAPTGAEQAVKTEDRKEVFTRRGDARAFAGAEVRDFSFLYDAVEIVAPADGRPVANNLPVLLTPATLRDDTILKQGEVLMVGDIIVRGILRNDADRAIVLKNAQSGVFFELLPGETVVVVARARSCKVECGSGYYACCNTNGNSATCQCKPNPEAHDCEAGGPGAPTCSIEAQ